MFIDPSLFAEPEDNDNPDTLTDKLLTRVEQTLEDIQTGNSWRYGNLVSSAVALTGLILGGQMLSPAISLLFLTGLGGAATSYLSYCLHEGQRLKIKPVWLPALSGDDEIIMEVLPPADKLHYLAIVHFGDDVVRRVELDGNLSELLRVIKSFRPNPNSDDLATEFNTYMGRIKNQIAPERKAIPAAREAIAPRQISQPKTPPPLESDIWDEPIAPSPLENPEDDLEDLAPEKKQHQEIEPSYQSPVAKPLKVISAKQIKQSAEGVANMYNWNDIVKAPHLLVIGSTGDGKSTLVKWLVETYCQDSSLMIIDPHTGYEDWGNLEVIGKGRDYSEVAGAFDYLQREMTDRYHLRATTKNPVFERLFVVVDEFASIAKNAPAVSRSMLSIAQEGRKVGIVLCLLAQGETVKTLGIEGEGEQRENFCRIRLGSFAQKMLMKSGQGHLASTYPRFCFVENSFAPLPNLEGFQIKNFKTVDDEPTIDPEPTPSFSPNDLLTWLEKKGDGHYKPRDISAKTKIPVAQIVEAANGLHTAGVIELKNWGELQGREIVYFKPQKASAYRDNLVAFPMGV